MPKLAINGGSPVRTEPYLSWPPVLDEEIAAVNRVLREGQMGRITRFGNGGSNETDKFREAWKQQYPGKDLAIPCGSCCDARGAETDTRKQAGLAWHAEDRPVDSDVRTRAISDIAHSIGP